MLKYLMTEDFKVTETNEINAEVKTSQLIKKIILFSLPLMFSNLLQVVFHMADIAVIGRFSGTVSLGAVGSTAVAITIFTGFLIGVGGSVNSLTSRYIGAKNNRELRRTTHTSLLLSAMIGVVILIIGVCLTRPLLELLGTKEELLSKACDYMRIYFLGMPALALYNFGNAVYSASGNTKKPLIFMSMAGILNVILNLIFVIVFHLDVVGVALASIISQYLSAILVVGSLFFETGDHRLCFSDLRLSLKNAGEILSLGVPAGLQNAIFYIANLFVQAGINSFDAVVVAGNSAASNADSVVYEMMNAVYMATGSFVGRYFGAGDKRGVKRSYLICQFYSFAVGTVVGLTLLVLGPQFLSLFTNDPLVIDAGMQKLSIMGLIYGISAFMDNAIAGSRGIGKSVLPTAFVIMGSCVFRIIWIFTVFAYFKTIPSLYLLYAFSWGITAILETVYFIRCYKKLKVKPVEKTLLS